MWAGMASASFSLPFTAFSMGMGQAVTASRAALASSVRASSSSENPALPDEGLLDLQVHGVSVAVQGLLHQTGVAVQGDAGLHQMLPAVRAGRSDLNPEIRVGVQQLPQPPVPQHPAGKSGSLVLIPRSSASSGTP